MNPSALVSGALWNTAARAFQLLAIVGTLTVVARFAGPEAFGLISLVWVVIGLVEQVLLGAIIDSTLSRTTISRRHYDTVFWAALAVSLAGAALIAGNARTIAHWLGGDPVLAELLIWRAPFLPLVTLIGTSQAMLIRDGQFKTQANIDMFANSVSAPVGIVLAMLGFGVWSLLVMDIMRQLLQCTLQVSRARWFPRLQFSTAALAELSSNALHSMGSTVSEFMVRIIPRLLIGQWLGSQALGYYAMAERLCEQVTRILVHPGFDIVKSGAARVRTDRDSLWQLHGAAVATSSLLVYPVLLGAAALAPVLLPWMLGDIWSAAVPIVQLMMIAQLRSPLSVYSAALLIGTGRLDRHNHLRAAQVLVTLIACAYAVPYGLGALGVALLLRGLAQSTLEVISLHQLFGLTPARQTSASLGHLGASLLMAAIVVAWISAAEGTGPAVLILMAGTVLGLATYGPALAMFAPHSWRSLRQVFAHLMRGEHEAIRNFLAAPQRSRRMAR